MIEFEIPSLPPGINATYKTTKKGGFYKSKDASEWQEKSALIIGSHAAIEEWQDNSEFYKIHIEIRGGQADVDASVKLVIDNGGDRLRNQKCWHCEEQLS